MTDKSMVIAVAGEEMLSQDELVAVAAATQSFSDLVDSHPEAVDEILSSLKPEYVTHFKTYIKPAAEKMSKLVKLAHDTARKAAQCDYVAHRIQRGELSNPNTKPGLAH